MHSRRARLLNDAAPFFARSPAPFVAPGFERERRRFRGGAGAAGGGSYTQENNDKAQAAVLALAQPMLQQVYSNSQYSGNNTAQGQVLNIPLNNVGLNTKLTIEITVTLGQAAAETLTRTQFGLSNLLSNIQLTDLSNYQRVNTTGWHLHQLACLRRQQEFGAAYVTDSPLNFGSNWKVNNAPASILGNQVVRFFYEVPLAYHDFDLRGAIYAAVTSATWRLQLTVNPNIIVAANAADPTLACYQSSTNANVGNVSSFTVAVYQHYLDQLPMSGGAPVVPLMSLAWNYLLQNTTVTGLVVGQDFPTQYANFRTFLSTMAIFDNNGTLNAGSDVNYWGIQAANLVFLEKYDPFMSALRTRNLIGADPPNGLYLFDHRRKPLVTNQYGNLQLVLNPSVVNSGASVQLGYEMLAIQSQAINAGSLAAS